MSIDGEWADVDVSGSRVRRSRRRKRSSSSVDKHGVAALRTIRSLSRSFVVRYATTGGYLNPVPIPLAIPYPLKQSNHHSFVQHLNRKDRVHFIPIPMKCFLLPT